MNAQHPDKRWRYALEDRRDMAKDEYDEPGIAIGCVIPDVGFVSIASVVFGCEEAKEIGGQMEIAQRIVDALNQAPREETKTLATPWDKCEFGIIAWEIDQGQIGISVEHAKGGSAWMVEPNEHVAALLRDGLRYRWLRVHGAALAGTEHEREGLVRRCVNLDEEVDRKMEADRG